ncbi:two-component system regulatory protein YycI [Salirhabdus sp. Marseille-P4669]|uniref:two-component system regulatory protein YycI n=1 Tax=Salirhabdus sp. Marseille-P4669 TaxID=2042310 RepID=UPI000C7CAD60|nr:two-component system regulatory protein YycI [Salirhabdus sp. Marseille-P4669]
MQWGQIKTIFIICFLVLDVYLITQAVVNDNENESIVITSPETTSIEEKLVEEKINFDKVPKESPKATYISAFWHTFTEEEIGQLEAKGQKVAYNDGMVYAEFEKPVPIKVESTPEDITEIIGSKILFADQYTFHHWNKDENVMIFFQHYNNQPIFYNNGGLLMVFLNEKNEATSYFQAKQEEIEQQAEEKEVSRPLEIVEVLLNEDKISEGDTISSMELGYHTFWPVGGVQAFVPTWKISVNEAENVFYVNALDGRTININEVEFLTDIREEANNLKALLELKEEMEEQEETEEEIEAEQGE